MSSQGVFDDTYVSPAAQLPFSQYNSTSQASGTLPASQVAGAMENVLASSGATALTLPTAAAIYMAVQKAYKLQYRLRIINTNAGTLTLTAGTGITINGTATIATNTWREFDVTITGQATCTFQSVGTGTYS